MKKKLFYIVLSFLLLSIVGLSGYKFYTDHNVDYFPLATQEDIDDILTEEGYEDCDEYKENLFLNDKKNELERRYLTAFSYEIGICVEQNIEKALEAYLKIYDDELLGFFTIRPAVIYRYGPQNLRDKEKADFFFKQAVITIGNSATKKERDIIFSGFLLNTKLPKELKREYEWLNKFSQKSQNEKREAVKTLEKEGFLDTSSIWNELEDIKPLQKPNFKN